MGALCEYSFCCRSIDVQCNAQVCKFSLLAELKPNTGMSSCLLAHAEVFGCRLHNLRILGEVLFDDQCHYTCNEPMQVLQKHIGELELRYIAVSGEDFGQNRLRSKYFQVQLVTCLHLSVFVISLRYIL